MNKIKFKNLESLIKMIKLDAKDIIKFQKMDGITILCTCKENNIDKAIEEFKQLISKYDINTMDVIKPKDKNNMFKISFPDFEPEYNEKEMQKMYKSNIEWLLQNLTNNSIDKEVTKDFILINKDVLTKSVIRTYYRSNVNPYRKSEEEFMNSLEFRKKIEEILNEVLDKFDFKKK